MGSIRRSADPLSRGRPARRWKVAPLAMVPAVAIGLTACGGGTGPSSSSTTNASTTASSAAKTKGHSKNEAQSKNDTIPALSGVDTELTLSQAISSALGSKSVGITAVAPGTSSKGSGTMVLSFPITGGHIAYDASDAGSTSGSDQALTGVVKTSGGFSVKIGSKTISMTDLVLNFAKHSVSGTVNGHAGTPLLTMTGTPQVKASGSELVVSGLGTSVTKSSPLASLGGAISSVGTLEVTAK